MSLLDPVWAAAEQEFTTHRGEAYPTPGVLAAALDPTTKQTPALDLIDAALVEVEAGAYDRLIISMPPQEGKGLALDTPIATPTGWTTMAST